MNSGKKSKYYMRIILDLWDNVLSIKQNDWFQQLDRWTVGIDEKHWELVEKKSKYYIRIILDVWDEAPCIRRNDCFEQVLLTIRIMNGRNLQKTFESVKRKCVIFR